MPPPTLATVVNFGTELTGYGGLGLALLYLFLCAAFFLGHRRLRSSVEEQKLRWQQNFLITWLTLPMVGSVAVSWLVTPVFEGRFLLVSLAPLPLLAAGGVRVLGSG